MGGEMVSVSMHRRSYRWGCFTWSSMTQYEKGMENAYCVVGDTFCYREKELLHRSFHSALPIRVSFYGTYAHATALESNCKCAWMPGEEYTMRSAS